MRDLLLLNLSKIAMKRAVNLRDEAGLLSMLARDLKRDAGPLEKAPRARMPRRPIAEVGDCSWDRRPSVSEGAAAGRE